MAGAVRTREDAWNLSVKTEDAATNQPWHPVLDGYARGVEKMMSRDNALTPDSWRWAANTHGAPAEDPANRMWRLCAHHQRFFLPWHRAYLAWFEDTIRAAIDDDGWALPYWNYSDPANPKALRLPPEFTVKQRTVDGRLVDNKLYLKSRDRPGQPRPENAVVSPALSQRFFVRASPVMGFGGIDGPERIGGTLEQRPHDYVHGDIGGGTGLMRTPALAARDPIFWLHHANIDRLWEVWRKLPGSVGLAEQGGVPASVVTEWRTADFAFGDANAPTVYAMSQLADTRADPLRYEYRVVDLPAAQLAEVTANRQRGRGGPMGLDDRTPREHRWDPVAATSTPTDVGAGGTRNELPFDARQLGLAPAVPAGLVVSLSGVRAAADCHNAYVVNVSVRAGAPVHRAGEFSTFGLAGTPADEERDYVIDATAVIPELVADGWNGRGLVVDVSPDDDSGGDSSGDNGIQIRQITVLSRR